MAKRGATTNANLDDHRAIAILVTHKIRDYHNRCPIMIVVVPHVLPIESLQARSAGWYIRLYIRPSAYYTI
jgi:hypothetical protein